MFFISVNSLIISEIPKNREPLINDAPKIDKKSTKESDAIPPIKPHTYIIHAMDIKREEIEFFS